MLEALVVGVVQGVTEWLPVSSEGAVIAIQNTFFPAGYSLPELIRFSLFLHLGTFLAALVYFRREVRELALTLLQSHEHSVEDKKVLSFLIVATFISGSVGAALYGAIETLEPLLVQGSIVVNLLIAALLVITGVLQVRVQSGGLKGAGDLSFKDGILLGVVQGFAVLPGLSRSGLTVSTLLVRKFDDAFSLKLSFLMSLPMVFAGNIVLNPELFTLTIPPSSLIALAASFGTGLFTIDLLLRLARRVNFGHFALFFAALVALSTLF